MTSIRERIEGLLDGKERSLEMYGKQLTIRTDFLPLKAAMLEVDDLLNRFPESGAEFLEGFATGDELYEVDDDYRASLAVIEEFLIFKPSEQLNEFTAGLQAQSHNQ